MKKSGSSINPDIHHSKVFSSELKTLESDTLNPELKTLEWDILNPDRIINLEIKNERRTSNI